MPKIFDAPAALWRGMMAAAPFRLWAQLGAGIARTLFTVAVVLILWKGPWSVAVEDKRVTGLVIIALASDFLVLIALVALTELQLSLRAGRQGLEANVVGDEHQLPPVAAVTTTTTTTVEAPAAAEPAVSPEAQAPWERPQ